MTLIIGYITHLKTCIYILLIRVYTQIFCIYPILRVCIQILNIYPNIEYIYPNIGYVPNLHVNMYIYPNIGYEPKKNPGAWKIILEVHIPKYWVWEHRNKYRSMKNNFGSALDPGGPNKIRTKIWNSIYTQILDLEKKILIHEQNQRRIGPTNELADERRGQPVAAAKLADDQRRQRRSSRISGSVTAWQRRLWRPGWEEEARGRTMSTTNLADDDQQPATKKLLHIRWCNSFATNVAED